MSAYELSQAIVEEAIKQDISLNPAFVVQSAKDFWELMPQMPFEIGVFYQCVDLHNNNHTIICKYYYKKSVIYIKFSDNLEYYSDDIGIWDFNKKYEDSSIETLFSFYGKYEGRDLVPDKIEFSYQHRHDILQYKKDIEYLMKRANKEN